MEILDPAIYFSLALPWLAAPSALSFPPIYLCAHWQGWARYHALAFLFCYSRWRAYAEANIPEMSLKCPSQTHVPDACFPAGGVVWEVLEGVC